LPPTLTCANHQTCKRLHPHLLHMKKRPHPKAPRVAISLEMEWGFKRHLEIYAGCQRFADEAGWNCFIHPAPEWEIKDSPATAPCKITSPKS